jgi:3-dehydroquinate synthase
MKLDVNLGSRSYPVFVDDNGNLPDILANTFPNRRFALVTNTTLSRLYDGILSNWKARLDFLKIEIEDGERYKNLETWGKVLDSLLLSGLDRSVVIIAFGGGVVGDITGFAAACFLRGVDYVQVPTTLLAMVDSSVGGKTGIDHHSGKNRIGAFHQPRMVWISTSFLKTLPERDFLSGYGEVFKYAFIGGRNMFSFILENHEKIIGREPGFLLQAITNSIRIKAEVVSDDEHEKTGRRALLNFGHTFAHALETFFNYEHVLHGEAVLWGIACAIEMGKRVKTIPDSSLREYDRIMQLLPRVNLPAKPDAERLCELMLSDKKTSNGRIRFVLPASPGEAVICDDTGKETAQAVIRYVVEGYAETQI